MNIRVLQAPAGPERPPLAAALVGSFLAMVVVDFLLHAVLLSQWWRTTGTFWRPPDQLFASIPYGYASFGLYAIGLNWLLIRLKGNRPPFRLAAVLGAVAGGFVGSAGILATYSVVPLPPSALLVFPASFAAVLAAAGASSALVLASARPWRRVALLGAVLFALFVLGIVLQNILLQTPKGQRLPPPVAHSRSGSIIALTSTLLRMS